MRRSLAAVLGGALSLTLALPAAAQTTIGSDTGYLWYGFGNSAYRPGEDPYYTSGTRYGVGQTFTVGADNVLDRFSFWLNDYGGHYNPAETIFRASLWAWDGATNRVQGTASVWESAVQGAATSTAMRERVFSTGGLALDAGRMYLAMLTPEPGWTPQWRSNNQYDDGYTEYFDQTANAALVAYADTYTGGTLVQRYIYSAHGAEYNDQYYTDPSMDAAFTATFGSAAAAPPSTVTPEPVSMALLGTGLAGIGALRRRRRKQADAA